MKEIDINSMNRSALWKLFVDLYVARREVDQYDRHAKDVFREAVIVTQTFLDEWEEWSGGSL